MDEVKPEGEGSGYPGAKLIPAVAGGGDPVDSMAYHAGRVKVAAAEEMKWQALLGKKLKTTPRKVGG